MTTMRLRVKHIMGTTRNAKIRARRIATLAGMLLITAMIALDVAPPPAYAATRVTTTNLVANPQAVTASTRVVGLRTNLIQNPRQANDTSRWHSASAGASGSATRVATGGPSGIANTWYKLALTSAPTDPTAVLSLSSSPEKTGADPIIGSRQYTASMYVRSSKNSGAGPNLFIRWYDSTGATISDSGGPSSAISPNVWERRTVTAAAPSNAAFALIYMAFHETRYVMVSGDYIGATGALLEESTHLEEYFDGGTSNDAYLTHSWAGAAHLSKSYKNGMEPANTYGAEGAAGASAYSQADPVTGDVFYSVRRSGVLGGDAFGAVHIAPPPGGFAGKTFTLILRAWADTPTNVFRTVALQENGSPWRYFVLLSGNSLIGTTPMEYRMTVTIPADSTVEEQRVILRPGPNSGDTIHYDNLMLVEGIYDGDYLDGDTAGAAWTGTAHASTSYMQEPAVLALTISQTLNGATSLVSGAGPASLAGDSRSWEYLVKNTGNVELSGVNVAVGSGRSATCPLATLAPDQVMTCTYTGVAGAGLYGIAP